MTPDSSDSSNESTRNKSYEAHLESSPQIHRRNLSGRTEQIAHIRNTLINNMYYYSVFVILVTMRNGRKGGD